MSLVDITLFNPETGYEVTIRTERDGERHEIINGRVKLGELEVVDIVEVATTKGTT